MFGVVSYPAPARCASPSVPGIGCLACFSVISTVGACVPLGFPLGARGVPLGFPLGVPLFPRGMLQPDPEGFIPFQPPKGGGIGMGARRKKVSTAKKDHKTADWIDHSGPPDAGRGMWQSVARRTTPRPGLHLLLCSRLHPVTNRGGAVSPHTRAETCAKTPLPVTTR